MRIFLCTTALAAALAALPALAQTSAQTSAPPATADANAATSPATGPSQQDRDFVRDAAGAQGSTATKPTAPMTGYAATKVDGEIARMTADELIGKEIRNSRGENLGDIENVVVGTDRTLHAVIGVGGFLGFGEKEVLVPLNQLQVNSDRAIMMSDASEQALKEMPAFTKDGYEDWPRNSPLAP